MNEANDKQPTERGFTASAGSVADVDRPVTIEEIERILASGEKPDIEIQPDGSIKAVPQGTAKNAVVKPMALKDVASHY